MKTICAAIDSNCPDPLLIDQAVGLLRNGEVVAFPTETVYGLGANTFDSLACAKIFKAKGRPQDNPLILHVSDLAMARDLADHWPDTAELCAQRFWPGPLTLVITKKPDIPDEVTGGLKTAGIRFPSHPIARAIIARAGFPLAAPSANLSGKPSPTSGYHVMRDLKGKIPMILDAGFCKVGLESTVLDLSSSQPTILRPGGITREQLEAVLGPVALDMPDNRQQPRAPGMKYRHYAPDGEMLLITGSREGILDMMREQVTEAKINKKKTGILCTLESASELEQASPDLLYVLGSENQPDEAAARLFEALHMCDEQQIDLVLAEGVDEGGIGLAIMNRLSKAAGHRIMKV